MKEPPRPESVDLFGKQFLVVGLVLVTYFAWAFRDLSRPWIGAHDWNGAAWSTAAKHLIERPVSETRMGVSLDHGSGPLDPKKFYVHHPPLVVWLMAAAYKMFGISEAVGRDVPFFFTFVGAIFLFGIGGLGEWRGSVFSAAIFLAMPSQLYYGRMPNHEPIALPMMLAASYFALLWSLRPTHRSLICCLVFVALACLSSWASFFFAATLGLVALRDEEKGRTLFIGVAATATATLCFLLWHIKFVRADGWTDLLAAFFLRSGTVGLGEWLTTEAHWLGRLLTPIGLAAVLLHAMRYLRLPPLAERTLLPLVVAGWANVLLFRQGAFVHEYYCFFLGAPAALIVGILLGREGSRSVSGIVLAAVVLAGFLVASDLRKEQSRLYASDIPESRQFIVELGRKIAEIFPSDSKLLVDVQPIGEHLAFYADRRMVYLAQTTESELAKVVAEVDGVVGNTKLSATRELLDRVLLLAAGRIVERTEFAVEGHTFLAVKLKK